MTVLTNETKSKLMRDAFATLASDYMKEGRYRDADKVLQAAQGMAAPVMSSVGSRIPELTAYEESWVRLYDIITKA